MLLLLLFLAGLGASPARLHGAPADPSPAPREEASYPEEPSADRLPFLHLRRGALIESIAFSAAYLRAAPHEDCLVLPSPDGTRLGGVAVYTKAGRLLLRSLTFGVVPLPGLVAADINHREKIIAAIAAVPRGRRLAAADAGESDEVQLHKAAVAVSFFPSALGEAVLAGESRGAPATKTRVLVLDWNQHHYLWNPLTGVVDVPVPINPLTHTPYLCVPEPELAGSVLFAAEYARLHPEERAEVLLDPRMTSHPRAWFARGAAVAAYTEGDRVALHTGSENLPLPEATRADFGDLAKLTAVALARYHRFLEERGDRPGPVPNGLIGDTRELQLKRTHFRLQVANARPGRTHQGENVLVIDCGCLQCVYAPGRGAAYSGWLPPYQALLVDGIVFAGEYLRAHPGEKAVVVAHPPSGRLTYPAGGINAHVFYTREGLLWGHLAEDHVGEYRIADARAAAITDRDRLLDLCFRDPSRQDALARAAPSLLGDAYHQSVAGLPAFDAAALGAEAVLAQLRAQGVPCRLVPERERAEDGRITEYPAPAVVFRWAGEAFVYARQKVYRALARGYPPDPAFN
jgi:hypothetical protein